MRNRSWLLELVLVSTVILSAVVTGCGEPESVRSYSVSKEPSDAPVAMRRPDLAPSTASQGPPARMLAAIFVHGQRAWFFKVVGPPEPIQAMATPFRDFLKTVRFAKDVAAKPTWTLPKDWKQIPGSAMRFATLHIGDGPDALDVTVIRLPMPPTDEKQYVLDNVNRWRGQLALAPVSAKELDGTVERLEVADKQVTLADLLGHRVAGPDQRRPPSDPHAGLPGFGPRDKKQPAATGPSGFDASALQCKPPASWKPARLGMMRKASFEVTDGDARVEISVMPAGGGLLANINRWRGQVQLAPVTQEVLDGQLQDISVGGLPGKYVALIGPKDKQPQQTILGTVVTVQGQAWFIKLKGDAALADREQKHFKSFVESIRFGKGL